jgi:prepilin-type N-terminal cleavage/methylation domain-containing protein
MSNRTASRSLRDRHVPGVRRGVTLVEMLVAIVMITFAALGLMGVSGNIAESSGDGMRHTVAAGIAQARLDSLTSLACASLASGAATGYSSNRGVIEKWSVVDGRNIKTIKVIVSIPRRKVPLTYETIVPCRD